MIKVKLDQLADRLGKSISDIARETGLNRNSVTALYHQKVDGIKFETLEKICKTYQVGLVEILELESDTTTGTVKPRLYRQEAECSLLTLMTPFLCCSTQNEKYIPKQLGPLRLFIQKDYLFAYWNLDDMRSAARAIFKKYQHSPEAFKKFYQVYLRSAEKIEQRYEQIPYMNLAVLPQEKLLAWVKEFYAEMFDFWNLSLFIDTFDAGVDQESIRQIADQHGFTAQEIGILTTPVELTFNNERVLEVLRLAKLLQSKHVDPKQLSQTVKQFVEHSSEVKQYIQDFDFYKSNYAKTLHISTSEVEQEMLKYLRDPHKLDQEYTKLKNYAREHEQTQERVLKKYKLTQQPLFFFQLLTYWREHRKKVNLQSFHVLTEFLKTLEQRTGIAEVYLRCLTHEEFEHVFKGLITQEQLKRRYEESVFVRTVEPFNYSLVEGAQAISLKDELEERLRGQLPTGVIKGQVACQGYAKGVARIILNTDDFHRFGEGEILVTGMTRPEFLPLMKKAAGIVTNEGGITCHAAIVSRELGKPCIIGTQQATHLIKDGQLVEVRANHGTVRIL